MSLVTHTLEICGFVATLIARHPVFTDGIKQSLE